MKKSSSLVPVSSFLRSRAFTIIELLVVIAIIALLTGIIMTSLVGSKAKARDAKRVSDLGNIQLALELYYDRCKQYPDADGDKIYLDANNAAGGTICSNGITLRTFISQIPTDPPGTPALDHYYYNLNNSGTQQSYLLVAYLETNNPALQDDVDGTQTNFGSEDCNDSPNFVYCLTSN